MSTRAIGKKILNNFGGGALQSLGTRGWVRYLGVAFSQAPKILRHGDLRPLDERIRGVLALRHPAIDHVVRFNLDAFRAIDEAEGSFTFGLLREIVFRNVYLRHFIVSNRWNSVADLGANRGVFTLLAATMANHVVAVEAQTDYRAAFEVNARLNGLDNISYVQRFVGGRGALGKTQDMKSITLAEALGLAPDGAVDLVKIDIEGSEFGLDLGALVGAKRLVMEVHRDWGSATVIVAKLDELGFESRTLDADLQPAPPDHADFVCAINRRFADAAWRAK